MRPILWLLLAATTLAAAPRTLRLDYIHSGTATEEHFAFDGLALEAEWPGRPDRLIDETNLGKYLFEVRDLSTNRLLYSRGFASIYGEWETTGEAKEIRRAFHESVRFPLPEAKAQVILKKRDRRNAFRELWSIIIDPADPAIDRSPPPNVKVWPVIQSGPPADKVDLLLIGDGYTQAEMNKWHADAKRLAETLFRVQPFDRAKFNVWAIDVPSEESGVARPSDAVYRKSALRAAYDAFGSERYVLTFDNKGLREIASAAPFEFIEIVVNGRKYGGGGIHNLYATVASDSASTPYVFVHEFGHHFAGLADEYYTSDVAYESSPERLEPWEPNVTADPKALKWKDLITKLPTPWPKREFEERQRAVLAKRREIRAEKRPEEEMEALFDAELVHSKRLLAPYKGIIGAFEGALYESKGYYRAEADCIMFTRNMDGFCAACRRAIQRVIEFYAR